MKVIKSLLDRCWSNCQLPLILLLALMQIRRIDGKSYCNRTLGQLANMQGEFTDCITKHSVPVTVCQNCQDIYRNMTQLYQNILNCSIFFDSDQLNLLPSTEQVLTNLWTKAACNGELWLLILFQHTFFNILFEILTVFLSNLFETLQKYSLEIEINTRLTNFHHIKFKNYFLFCSKRKRCFRKHLLEINKLPDTGNLILIWREMMTWLY